MKLKITQFIALFLLLLITGVFWGPWFGLHRSLEVFSAAELIHITKAIAQNLAVPMRFIMPACIAFMVLSAWFYPNKKSGEFYATVAAITFIIIALVITVLVEVPIVNQIKDWTVTSVPSDWESIRDRWVFFHGVRTFTALVGFGCFSITILQFFKQQN